MLDKKANIRLRPTERLDQKVPSLKVFFYINVVILFVFYKTIRITARYFSLYTYVYLCILMYTYDYVMQTFVNFINI